MLRDSRPHVCTGLPISALFLYYSEIHPAQIGGIEAGGFRMLVAVLEQAKMQDDLVIGVTLEITTTIDPPKLQ